MTTVDWIPVTERLPELSTDVLIYAVYTTDSTMAIAYLEVSWEEINKPAWFCSEERVSKWNWDCVTHWCELPAPPKEAE